MERKNVLKSYKLADQASMLASFNTGALDVNELDNIGLQFSYVTYASLLSEGIRYTARAEGASSVTVTKVDDATSGTESVIVVGNAITLHIEAGVSTATVMHALLEASAATQLLVSTTLVTGATVQTASVAAGLVSGAGTFAVQATNGDGLEQPDDTVWTDLSFSTPIPSVTPAGSSFVLSLHQIPYARIRVAYTATTGSGTLTVKAEGKMI